MGWFGTLFLGAVIGWGSTWRNQGKHAPWMVALACALVAMVVKMLGNIVGLFDDGSIVEWLVSVAAAVVTSSVLRRLPAAPVRRKRGSTQ